MDGVFIESFGSLAVEKSCVKNATGVLSVSTGSGGRL